MDVPIEDAVERFGPGAFDIVVLNRPGVPSSEEPDPSTTTFFQTFDHVLVDQIGIARRLVRQGGILVVTLAKCDNNLLGHIPLARRLLNGDARMDGEFAVLPEADGIELPEGYVPHSMGQDMAAFFLARRVV